MSDVVAVFADDSAEAENQHTKRRKKKKMRIINQDNQNDPRDSLLERTVSHQLAREMPQRKLREEATQKRGEGEGGSERAVLQRR